MDDIVRAIFLDNLDVGQEIAAFCRKNPEYCKRRQEFLAVADEIAELVGFERYERFEDVLGQYLGCSNDIHYLFGLGLRQDILSALGVEE